MLGHRRPYGAAHNAVRAGTHAGRVIHDLYQRYKRQRQETTPPRSAKRPKSAHKRGHALVYRKGSEGFIVTPSAGESHSNGFHGRKKKATLPPGSQPTTVICDILIERTWLSNLQLSYESVFSFFGNNTFTTNPTSLNSANADVLQLNALSRRDLANSSNPILGQYDKGRKLFIHSVSTETVFTNDASSDIQIFIYDLVSKTTRTADFNGNYTPNLLWAEGASAESDFASLSITQIGRLPTQNKIFNMAWKVMKLTRVELSAGRTHVHNFLFSPQVMVDLQYFNTNAVVRGISTTQLIIVHGCNLVSATTTAGSNIGVAPGVLFSKTTCKYKVTPIDVPPKKVFLFENCNQQLTVGQTSEMNEETAVPLVNTFA